jgi:Fur family transcriptional regulator, peroxide stress response regulator
MTKRESKLRETLQAHGLRYSRPREIILNFFGERDLHVSAEDLYVELKRRGENLSLSTVYLNLGVLKQAGLVREFNGVGGEALYDSNTGPHHHLICTQCGAILDLPDIVVSNATLMTLLKRQAELSSGWQVEEPNLDLQGICPSCLARERVVASARAVAPSGIPKDPKP